MAKFSLPALAPPTAMSVAQLVDGPLSPNDSKAPSFGMSMWFEVQIEGIGDATKLGRWSSCTGLGVTFTTEEVKTGPSSVGPILAPVDIVYPDITLTRAMEPGSSKNVQKWLKLVAEHWMLDDGAGTGRFPGTTVHITLYSSLRPDDDKPDTHEVAHWELNDVYPKSWSGPSLNASGNEIATEKLVLAHGGFLKLDKDVDPFITLTDGKKTLRFPYMPAELKTSQSRSSNKSTTMLNKEDTSVDREQLSFSFTVRIEGRAEVAWTDERLTAWMTKPLTGDGWTKTESKSETGGAGRTNWKFGKIEAPRALVLRIGRGAGRIERVVVLRQVSPYFKRFTVDGVPSRADFTLQFQALEETKGTHETYQLSISELGSELPSPRTWGLTQPRSLMISRPSRGGGSRVSAARKGDTLSSGSGPS